MNSAENHYKVTNRDRNDSLPEIFATFTEAFDALKEWDDFATIECFSGDTVEVVWQQDYSNFVSNVFVI